MAKHLGEENTIPVGSEKHEQYVRELADESCVYTYDFGKCFETAF